MLTINIGPYTIQRRTQYSKVQVLNINGENISNTDEGKKILADYDFQTNNPDKCFKIDCDELLEFKDDCYQNIKYLFIPDYITSIEGNIFKQRNFTYVHLPENLGYIGDNAFEGCSNLKEVCIPTDFDGIIDWSAFKNCTSLKKVILPEDLKEIPKFVFNKCLLLDDINLPNTLTRIGEYAFNKCSSLKNIVLPDTVTEIEDYAFNNCNKLQKINIPRDFQQIGVRVFAESGLKELVFNYDLPEREEFCYGDFFMYCAIDKITISNNVNTIDPFIFTRIGKQIKEITFLGTKKEFTNFSLTNRYMMRNLQHAKIKIIDKNLDNVIKDNKTGYIDKFKKIFTER